MSLGYFATRAEAVERELLERERIARDAVARRAAEGLTEAQAAAARKARASTYRGVTTMRAISQKSGEERVVFLARIRPPGGNTVHLGTFSAERFGTLDAAEHAAAKAYDARAREYYGAAAVTNFGDDDTDDDDAPDAAAAPPPPPPPPPPPLKKARRRRGRSVSADEEVSPCALAAGAPALSATPVAPPARPAMVIVDPIEIELGTKRARSDDDETASETSSSEAPSELGSTPRVLETPAHSRSGSFASLCDDGAPAEPAAEPTAEPAAEPATCSPPPRGFAAAAESPLDLLVESALWVRQQRETATPCEQRR